MIATIPIISSGKGDELATANNTLVYTKN